MKKRTKLVSLFAAVAGAATLLVSPAFGDTAPPNSFVHVSSHSTLETHSITIAEWRLDSANNPMMLASDVWTASSGDSWFWPVTKTGISYITLQEGDGSPQKINGTPSCWRITSSGEFHQADGSCTSDGHKVQWDG